MYALDNNSLYPYLVAHVEDIWKFQQNKNRWTEQELLSMETFISYSLVESQTDHSQQVGKIRVSSITYTQ